MTNRFAAAVRTGFLCLCVSLSGWASDSTAATLDRLRSFVRDTQTARTTFTQVVTDRAGRVVQRSTGEFMLSRPGKFRWSLDKGAADATQLGYVPLPE